MYTTKEEYARAVEASIADDASKIADKKYHCDLRYGRYAWRELHHNLCGTRLAAYGESITLDGYIKRCLAIDVVMARRDGDDFTKSHAEMCTLFNITPEYVAEQEALSESDAWDQ